MSDDGIRHGEASEAPLPSHFGKGPRCALVVGVSNYPSELQLRSPVNDARAVERALLDRGFSVSRLDDPDSEDFQKGFAGFLSTIPEDSMVVFYFSGHGMQLDGEVYLLPVVDVSQQPVNALRQASLHLTTLLSELAAPRPGIVVAILDACRNQPFGSRSTGQQDESGKRVVVVSKDQDMDVAEKAGDPPRLSWAESGEQPIDTEIIFAAAGGKSAYDGETLSPFTAILLDELSHDTDRVIDALFKSVTTRMSNATDGKQIPWRHHSARFEYYLTPSDGIWRRPILTQSTPVPLDIRNPYQGLDAFDEDTAQWFFGRDRAIKDVLKKVEQHWSKPGGRGTCQNGPVWIIGPSGCGKSSLVRAGVIYRIKREGAISGGKTWLIIKMSPGGTPLNTLAERLAGVLGQTNAEFLSRLKTTLHDDPGYLSTVLRDALERADFGHRCSGGLLLIDQVEEVFSDKVDPQEREDFLNVLEALANGLALPVLPILVIREDLAYRLDVRPTLGSHLRNHHYRVWPLDANELLDAITEPAKAAGLRFEEGLVETIQNDARGETDMLPLLEYTLERLAERSISRGSWQISHADYRDMGRVQGALSTHADDIYATIEDEREKRILEQILLRLVANDSTASRLKHSDSRPSETVGVEGRFYLRQRVLSSDLLTGGAEQDGCVHKLLQLLISKRLLVAENEAGSGRSVVTLAHEALIRSWPALQKLITENRDSIAFRQRLDEAVVHWMEAGRAEGHLWRDELLQQANRWKESRADNESISGRELDFLIACNALDQRVSRNRKRIRAALLGLTAASLIFAAVSWRMRENAEEQRQTALAEKLISDIQYLKSSNSEDRVLRALLAKESLTLHKSSMGGQLLHGDLSLLPVKVAEFRQRSENIGVEYSPDGRYVLIHEWPKQEGYNTTPARLFDLTSGKLVKDLSSLGFNGFLVGNASPDPQFCPNSQCLVWISDGRLVKLDFETGQEQQGSAGNIVGIGQFSQDSKRLLAHDQEHGLRVYEVSNLSEVFRTDQSEYRVAEFDPDNQSLWRIADDQRTVQRVEVPSGRVTMSLVSDETVAGLDMTSDPKIVATISWVGGQTNPALWDRKTGRRLPLPYKVGKVEWAPAGRHAVIWPLEGSDGDDAYLYKGQLWDLHVGRPSSLSEFLSGGIGKTAFSADGRYLAALVGGSTPNTWILWDIKLDKEIHRRSCEAKDCSFLRIAISPNGDKLVVDNNGFFEIFDAPKFDTARRLEGLNSENVGFDTSGDRLIGSVSNAIGKSTAMIRLRNAKTGEITMDSTAPGSLDRRQISADGSAFVMESKFNGFGTIWQRSGNDAILKVAYGNPSLWADDYRFAIYCRRNGPECIAVDLAGRRKDLFKHSVDPGPEEEKSYRKHLMSGINQDGTFLLHCDRRSVAVWNLDTKQEVLGIHLEDPDAQVDMSQDALTIAVRTRGQVDIWDVSIGKQNGHFQLDDDTNFWSLSPDGKWLITKAKNQLRSVNLATSHSATSKLDGEIRSVAYSANGELVAFRMEDGSIHVNRIHDMQDGFNTAPDIEFIKGAGPEESTPQFTRDARFLVFNATDRDTEPTGGGTSNKKEVQVLDLQNREIVAHWSGGLSDIAPDGQSVVTVEKDRVHLWSLVDFSEFATLTPSNLKSQYGIHAAKFSNDSRFVAVADDAKIFVFERSSGQEIARLPLLPDSRATDDRETIDFQGFSSGSRYLVAASSNKEKIWRTLWHPDDLKEETCHRVWRNLTREEWQKYLGDEPYRKTCPDLPEPEVRPKA